MQNCSKLDCFSEYPFSTQRVGFMPREMVTLEKPAPEYSSPGYFAYRKITLSLGSVPSLQDSDGDKAHLQISCQDGCEQVELFLPGRSRHFSFSKSNFLGSVGKGNGNFTSSGPFGQSVGCALCTRNICSFLTDSNSILVPQAPQGSP